MSTGEPIAVFHLLELDLPTPGKRIPSAHVYNASDNGTKKYLYGAVAVKDVVPRLARLRNAHDCESEVFQASANLVRGREHRSHTDSVRITLPTDTPVATLDKHLIEHSWRI